MEVEQRDAEQERPFEQSNAEDHAEDATVTIEEEIVELQRRLKELNRKRCQKSVFERHAVKHDNGWMHTLGITRYPRVCSVFFGIILPLIILIILSVFCGVILSMAEGTSEVESNDGFLAAVADARTEANFLVEMSSILPVSCLQADYLSDEVSEEYMMNMYREFKASGEHVVLSPELEGGYMQGNDIMVNTTSQIEFVMACGKESVNMINDLYNSAQKARLALGGDLTFNWIRCFNGASGILQKQLRFGSQQRARENKVAIRPGEQVKYYTEQWELNRQEIFEELMRNTSQISPTDAYWESVRTATGGGGCGFNTPASAWFFFTIMTTVGYGNQAPVSDIGRLTVFVFGFISLLLFGVLLTLSGRVLTALVDDFLVINRLHFLSGPKLGFLFWGFLYWAWMVVLGRMVNHMKSIRLNQPQPDLFWFAYISSTTIGLGDIFIEPEIILFQDMFWLPFVFLIGFVLFSAFLGKMVEVLASLFAHDESHPFLLDILLGKLHSIEPPEEESKGNVSDEDCYCEDIDKQNI